jgi:DNA polymerase III subunit chi
MTQVNFYSLQSSDSNSRLVFACRLAEKARSLGHEVFIQLDGEQQSRLMDDLLWEFSPGSFLPHSLASAKGEKEKVVIGEPGASGNHSDVLINLHSQPCENPQQFSRINEIIIQDEEILQSGRERFRFYKQLGIQPETFKL